MVLTDFLQPTVFIRTVFVVVARPVYNRMSKSKRLRRNIFDIIDFLIDGWNDND